MAGTVAAASSNFEPGLVLGTSWIRVVCIAVAATAVHLLHIRQLMLDSQQSRLNPVAAITCNMYVMLVLSCNGLSANSP
jgi:hypothetical protein